MSIYRHSGSFAGRQSTRGTDALQPALAHGAGLGDQLLDAADGTVKVGADGLHLARPVLGLWAEPGQGRG